VSTAGGRGRGLVVWLVLAAAVVVVAVLLPSGDARPYDLDSADVAGYRAVRLLLEAGGTEVRRVDADDVDAARVATTPVAYVPVATGATALQVARWRSFVEAGGTLVLGTPAEGIGVQVDESEAVVLQPTTFSGTGDLSIDPGYCDLEVVADLEVLAVSPWGVELPVGEADSSCFGDGYSAAVVRATSGGGVVVNLTSPDLFTNDVMGAPRKDENDGAPRDLPDNGALAVRLLGTAPSVAVVTAGVATTARIGPGTKEWTDFLSPGVSLALGQLAVAAGLYVWSRGRRHGRVVSEPVPVTIEASSLVAAVGDLLARHGDAARAAAAVRAAARVRWSHDLGLGRRAEIVELAAVVGARTGRDPAEIAALLEGEPVRSDAELANLVHRLDHVHQEALHV